MKTAADYARGYPECEARKPGRSRGWHGGVIEGGHGSCCFRPDTPAAHAAWQCLIDEVTWEQGIRELYAIRESDAGSFCHTFIKAVARR